MKARGKNFATRDLRGILRIIAILFAPIVLILIVSASALWFWTASQLPDLQTLMRITPPKCKIEISTDVERSPLPRWRIDALQAIESPDGLNPFAVPSVRIVGYLVTVPLAALGFKSKLPEVGASGRLAGQLFYNFQPNKHTVTSSFKQLVLSDMIEIQLDERQIATALLDRSYFGQGATGLHCAAVTRYNSSVETLTIAQFAMLIGLLKGPSHYDPFRYPDRARERRNEVLKIWFDQGIASEADIEAAKLEPLR